MLRAALEAQTEVGRAAQDYMKKGELVPDRVVIEVAGERLRRPDASEGFVLDGFPRTVAQAEALDALLARLGSKLELCLSLEVDEGALVERLLKRAQIEGRSDDNKEAIRNRMRVYRERTQPLIDYYRARGILAQVDGLGGIGEIARRAEEARST
jgi:adenylate kinase